MNQCALSVWEVSLSAVYALPLTLVFQGRRNTEVHLLPDIGHCAVLGGPSKLPEVVDLIARWLPVHIG
jgi:hypothetical protein